MSLNEDYSNMDAAQLRKMLQQKSLISQKYRTLDAVGGGEEYCYFRTKEDSFKPSKNQGAGLTIEFFEEEASSKGLKRGLDYFISSEDYRTFIDSCKSNLETGAQRKNQQHDEELLKDPEELKQDEHIKQKLAEDNLGNPILEFGLKRKEPPTEDPDPITTPPPPVKQPKEPKHESLCPEKYCIIRSGEFKDSQGVLLTCTSKATFGFPGDAPEKAFVCRKHKKAEFHGLFKGQFGYAAEVMMPALAHIRKAGAGPPTVSIEGKKLTAAERKVRQKEQYGMGTHFEASIHTETSRVIEKLEVDNSTLVSENLYLKDQNACLLRQNFELRRDLAVVAGKYNVLHSLVTGGQLSISNLQGQSSGVPTDDQFGSTPVNPPFVSASYQPPISMDRRTPQTMGPTHFFAPSHQIGPLGIHETNLAPLQPPHPVQMERYLAGNVEQSSFFISGQQNTGMPTNLSGGSSFQHSYHTSQFNPSNQGNMY